MSTPSGDDRGDAALADRVRHALVGAGLSAAGVAPAEPFTEARRHLHARRAAGLHGGMGFTYRNPDRSTDPRRTFPWARSLVVGALSYLRDEPPDPPDAIAPARVARYARWDAYGALERALAVGATLLKGAGFKAVVVADQNHLVDREAARLAGIGWYGRNANLLLPGQGSWFVLGSIVTDAALPQSPRVAPGCGACTRCLTSCPTDAIVEPGVVDARRCLAWLLQDSGVFPPEFREALGDRLYGCDECQEVCPPNGRARPAAAGDADRAVVDAVMFLEPDDSTVVRNAGRWYIPELNARYLRRNALVVLGNTAAPTDARAASLVAGALQHADPLVRAHAVWAAARLGRRDLVAALAATEADPMVRAELDRFDAVPVRR